MLYTLSLSFSVYLKMDFFPSTSFWLIGWVCIFKGKSDSSMAMIPGSLKS